MTAPDNSGFPFADLALARRLERVEMLGTSRFVEARARLFPQTGAAWIEVAGAYAMFDGVSSPVTQTFGLGMWRTPGAGDLERLEAFFLERQAPVFHEVSPLADPAVVPLLNDRGYHPFEFTSVMYQPIRLDAAAGDVRRQSSGVRGPTRIRVRSLGQNEAGLYARTAAAGWSEFGYGEFMQEVGIVGADTEGGHLFVAELDGEPIATGALNLHEGVAHFAGASTVPAGRRHGAQLALLHHRLQFAASHGCDIATIGANPGSGSQRNAERNGFRIAYTRVKWKRHG